MMSLGRLLSLQLYLALQKMFAVAFGPSRNCIPLIDSPLEIGDLRELDFSLLKSPLIEFQEITLDIRIILLTFLSFKIKDFHKNDKDQKPIGDSQRKSVIEVKITTN